MTTLQILKPAAYQNKENQKLSEIRTTVKTNSKSAESLIRLNEIANKVPFCIIYHTKKHDPL